MVDLSKRRLFSRRTLTPTAVRLPWLREPNRFSDLCTQCGKCGDACDTQIIVKGDGGFPQVNFALDECSFCYQCAEVCPESLFLSKDAQPWHAKAGIQSSCLAQQNVDCRACAESCESMAIQFRLEIGRVAQPNLNADLCTGCGACVAPCPTQAITVSMIQESQ